MDLLSNTCYHLVQRLFFCPSLQEVHFLLGRWMRTWLPREKQPGRYRDMGSVLSSEMALGNHVKRNMKGSAAGQNMCLKWARLEAIICSEPLAEEGGHSRTGGAPGIWKPPWSPSREGPRTTTVTALAIQTSVRPQSVKQQEKIILSLLCACLLNLNEAALFLLQHWHPHHSVLHWNIYRCNFAFTFNL